MTRRRVPRWSELRVYLRTGPVRLFPVDRRLASAATIWDLRRVARRHVPRAVFDYVDGAAETETSLQRSRDAFRRVEFVPKVLRDVSDVDLSTSILGRTASMPLIFAPTGFTRLMHQEGEPSVVRVASRMGIPFALSTLGTTSPEDVAEAAPDADRWFQLYLWDDREAAIDLVRRARASGFRVLVLTVDTPVAGARLRDVHNGFTIPPTLSLRTLVDIGLHPGWWFDKLSTDPLKFAVFTETGGTVADLINRVFDPTITIADLGLDPRDVGRSHRHEGDPDGRRRPRGRRRGRRRDRGLEPRGQAAGPCVDAPRTAGVDQGRRRRAGRGLPRRRGPQRIRRRSRRWPWAPTPCMVGRAYLYGLMAGGERGVARAGELLRKEATRTMQLLGVRRVADLDATSARLRDR